MNSINIKTAAKATEIIMIPFEMLYCIFCGILITLPIYLGLNIICGVVRLFSVPQEEKPSQAEIIEAEDKVLNSGGAFASCFGFL